MINQFRQFHHAIVRMPPLSMSQGITTQNDPVDIELARTQHKKYIETLKLLNVELIQLDANEAFPDSHFVEDVAIIYNNNIILTNPGALERREETQDIKKYLPQNLNIIELNLSKDETIDGGDVLVVNDEVFIGLSYRTSLKGAHALTNALKKINTKIVTHFIEFDGVLHLKSGLIALNENTFLGNPNMQFKKPFPHGKIIWLPKGEGYAANSLILNNAALVFSECKETQKILKEQNLTPIPLDMSEFKKMDGSFTCLSLLW